MGSDRARQFKPFAALKGFYELIAQKERVIVPKIELSEDMTELLSMKMNQIETGMMVTVTHYDHGEYIRTEGMVLEMDTTFRTLTVVKTKIAFDDILDITAKELEEL